MPETPVTFHSFTSTQQLAENLAEKIAGSLTDSISSKKHASLVVSGGSTPRPLFSQLSLKKIAWQKVTITLADERWVKSTDPSSNELLVRSLLLQNEAVNARFIGLKNSAPTATDGKLKCHKAISVISRPFDVVILGMGNDGHTASLFPGADGLENAVDMQSGLSCIALTPPDTPHERMSLTLPALLDSAKIILHISGEGKRKVLEKALSQGSPNDMPIRWILRQQKTPVQIFWAP